MRIKALLLALAVAGFSASFALASDDDKDGKKGGTTATTGTTTTGKKKDKACRNVSLKGTAAATTFTITVDKANNAGADLKGKPATLTFSGKVNVNARMCAATTAGGAATFELRTLKVAKGEDDKKKDD